MEPEETEAYASPPKPRLRHKTAVGAHPSDEQPAFVSAQTASEYVRVTVNNDEGLHSLLLTKAEFQHMVLGFGQLFLDLEDA